MTKIDNPAAGGLAKHPTIEVYIGEPDLTSMHLLSQTRLGNVTAIKITADKEKNIYAKPIVSEVGGYVYELIIED